MTNYREGDYADIPNSPELPAPDAEVQLPSRSINSSQIDFLDLNPDLEERTNKPIAQTPKYDNREDFNPVLKASPIPTIEIRPRRLSAIQQTKFNSYVEEQLHHIQRNFIQSLGLGEHGYPNLTYLLIDVKNLIKFIWLSIDPSNNNRNLYSNSTLFGQTNYLISIANDLLEYLVKFELNDESTTLLLKILQSLDLKFSKLIDGDIPGSIKLNLTETVRIHGIAERTRVFVADYFEKNKIEGYHYELSKIYENVLERTG